MKFSILSNIGVAIVGALFALTGVGYLVIGIYGQVEVGRPALIAAGCVFVALALPCFAYFFSRRLAKILGVVDLLAFAAGVLWLSFRPANPAPNPSIYQLGSIALFVLLLARVITSSRGRRDQRDS